MFDHGFPKTECVSQVELRGHHDDSSGQERHQQGVQQACGIGHRHDVQHSGVGAESHAIVKHFGVSNQVSGRVANPLGFPRRGGCKGNAKLVVQIPGERSHGLAVEIAEQAFSRNGI